jgi:hypothetical protein
LSIGGWNRHNRVLAATAQAVQLMIEYDPQPPFDAGSPAKAPQAVHDLLARR